ncbi:MAG: DUF1573 domain-containing protein [Planctomycetota bacterium]
MGVDPAGVSPGTDGVATDVPPDLGPQPLAVMPVTEFDFGVMRAGEVGKYGFKILNEGDAVLRLSPVETTCSCTVAGTPTDTVPPGEEAVVTVEWNPDKPFESFTQRASVDTNDPANSQLMFSITGKVTELVVVEPRRRWDVGVLGGEREPAEVSGVIYSEIVDAFDVVEAVTDSDTLEVSWAPLPAERLEKLEAKSGYEVTAKIEISERVGAFSESFDLVASVPGETDEDGAPLPLNFPIELKGRRSGEIVFVATPGVQWSAPRSLLSLGDFAGEDGASAELIVFVAGMGEERFQVTSLDDPTGRLTATSEFLGDVAGGKRQRHRLTIAARAPVGVGDFTGRSAAEITLRTNHPRIESIPLRIDFRVR